MYKHKDFGFNFTVDTNAKIPEDLVSKKDFVGITELAKSSLLLANNN